MSIVTDQLDSVNSCDLSKLRTVRGSAELDAPPVASEPEALYSVVTYPKTKPADRCEYSNRDPMKAMEQALADLSIDGREPIIQFDVEGWAAFLDLDWHYPNPGDRLTQEQAERIVARIVPAPHQWWLSHGQGIKAVYFGDDVISGEEYATLAARYVARGMVWSVGARQPTSCEVMGKAFHPGYPRLSDGSRCGPVLKGEGPRLNRKADEFVGRLFGTVVGVPDDVVNEWLEENGYERGRTYEHSRCPIARATGDPHQSHGSPVWVGEHGIDCKSCKQYGNVHPFGSTPGFVPWKALVDQDKVTRRENWLLSAVKNYTHWGQAKHIIRYEIGIDGRQAQAFYRLLLKVYHRQKDVGIPADVVNQFVRMAFLDYGVLRVDNGWAWENDVSRMIDDKGLRLVDSMPTAMSPMYHEKRQEWQLKPDNIRSARLKSNGCVTKYGYPAVAPIIGADITGVIDRKDDTRRTVPALIPADPPFRYRLKAERDKLRSGIIGDYLEMQFPGVCVPLLKLLIGLKAYAQHGGTEPGRVYIEGQSGSAKTSHVRLAMEIACEREQVPMLSIDEPDDRFRRMYSELSRMSSVVMTDEIAKAKTKGKELTNKILSLTGGTQVHILYKGKGSFGQPAGHVLCDTIVTDEFRKEVQLRRRTVYAPLGSGIIGGAKSIDWRQTCDGGNIVGWRKRASVNADFADCLLSDVQDEVRKFVRQGKPFEDYAASLGFSLLHDALEGSDPDADAKVLFKAVMALQDADDSRFTGRGWKVIDLNAETPASVALKSLLGDKNDEQAVSARQWGGFSTSPAYSAVSSSGRTHHSSASTRVATGRSRRNST